MSAGERCGGSQYCLCTADRDQCHHCGAFPAVLDEAGTLQVGEPLCIDCAPKLRLEPDPDDYEPSGCPVCGGTSPPSEHVECLENGLGAFPDPDDRYPGRV